MFSKVFLLLSTEHAEEEMGSVARVGNLLLNYSDNM
jgi:hypothetical protein